MSFLDTDVLIDITKGSKGAVGFLQALTTPTLTISSMVAMEFMIGSRDRFELQRAERVLMRCDVVGLNENDHAVSVSLVRRYCLSTGLSIVDFLIAAQALNRSAVLYTFNLKHSGAILGLDVRAPYARTAP